MVAATVMPMQLCPQVCLIHGPFGSGKSSLLVALVHLLVGKCREQQQAVQLPEGEPDSSKVAEGTGAKRSSSKDRKPRILVAAHTNVAVDRVLLGLVEAGTIAD